jgi:hypothetical protein
LEAGSAEHGPALGWLEGHGCFSAALRARSASFGAHPEASARALGLALLAVLGVVFELFVVEKQLLAGGKHKVGATVSTFQYSIVEIHGRLPCNRELFPIRPCLLRRVAVGGDPCSLSRYTTRARTAVETSGNAISPGFNGRGKTQPRALTLQPAKIHHFAQCRTVLTLAFPAASIFGMPEPPVPAHLQRS